MISKRSLEYTQVIKKALKYVWMVCPGTINWMYYVKLSMQYTEIFSEEKFENFIEKIYIYIFLIGLLKTLIVGTR